MNPPHIRFYAGCPVRTADGNIVGTLILLDTEPRAFADAESQVLSQLARLVEEELYWNEEDSLDPVTRVFNQQTTETRVPQILELCAGLMLPCTLHVFELTNLTPGPVNDDNRRNQHLLTAFARALDECYSEPHFLGRFDRDKFVMLVIGGDEKEEKLARWKLESAIRSHNHNAVPELEIQYRLGSAHTQPAGKYQFQLLLDDADLAMSPL